MVLGVRLARLDDGELDAEHREERVGLPLRLAGEAHAAPSRAVVPAGVARVHDEPARGDWHEPVLGLLELCLGDHGGMLRAVPQHTDL